MAKILSSEVSGKQPDIIVRHRYPFERFSDVLLGKQNGESGIPGGPPKEQPGQFGMARLESRRVVLLGAHFVHSRGVPNHS
jgi:hypothetical protein